MKADLSRLTFNPDRRYAGVVHQQGRAWLDSDWNEELQARLHYAQQQAMDMVGHQGGPRSGAGFKIVANVDESAEQLDFRITSGRYYVGGLVAELAPPIPATPMSSRELHVGTIGRGRARLSAGNWVEVFVAQRPHSPLQLAQIVAVDDENSTLTLHIELAEELRGAQSVHVQPVTTYLTQPGYPSPPPIALGDDQRRLRALVYVEVWQRLVSALQDEHLVEPALGGPDTAARIQSVAQVKVLPLADGDGDYAARDGEREDDDALRMDLGRLLPTSGRGTLTILDPTHYTRRENHLYRIEIHQSGEVLDRRGDHSRAFALALGRDAQAGDRLIWLQHRPTAEQIQQLQRSEGVTLRDERSGPATVRVVAVEGADARQVLLSDEIQNSYSMNDGAQLTNAARFKWSRDNAARGVRVTDVASDRSTLTLRSLGLDSTVPLQQGDWVEIEDNVSELGPGHGHLTQLAAEPDPDEYTVRVVDPLPFEFLDPARRGSGGHLTLRRWDGVGYAQADFDPDATPDLDLGDGIQIQFGGSDLRAGDYWQSAARSSTGELESLTAAPPRGIERQRAPLALVRWERTDVYGLPAVLRAAEEADVPYEDRERLSERIERQRRPRLSLAELEQLADDADLESDQTQTMMNVLAEMDGEEELRFGVRDVRQLFQPLAQEPADASVAVLPGHSIQAAIDNLGPDGGVVYLAAGLHVLPRTVVVRDRHNLTVCGAGAATEVAAPRGAVAFRFVRCQRLTVRDLAVSSRFASRAEPDYATPLEERGREDPARRELEPEDYDGLVTFLRCRVVDVSRCTLESARQEHGLRRACLAFFGRMPDHPDAPLPPPVQSSAETLSGVDTSQRTAAAQYAPGGLLGRAWSGITSRLARPSPPNVQPATSTPMQADLTMAAAAVEAASALGQLLDLTISDCRLYVGPEQIGAAIGGGVGVAVRGTWALPLVEGERDVEGLAGALRENRATAAFALVLCDVVSLNDNVAMGFAEGISIASPVNATVRGNTLRNCGLGLGIARFRRALVTENMIEADDGPAAETVSHRGEITLQGNNLSGIYRSRHPVPVARVQAARVNVMGNVFHGESQVTFDPAVSVIGHVVSFANNQSFCATQASTNVDLQAAPEERWPGSINATGNVCREPHDPRHEGFFAAVRDDLAAARQDIESVLSEAAEQGTYQQFQQRVRQIRRQRPARRGDAESGAPISLSAQAEIVVTGLNVLSYRLRRSGDGHDAANAIGVLR